MRQNASVAIGWIIGVRVLVVLLFFGIVWSLVKNYFELSKLDERLSEARNLNYTLKVENDKLIEEAREASLSASKEKAIRDKLGLVKPGETVVIISDDEIDPILSKKFPKKVESSAGEPVELKNWQKWLELFF